MMNNYNKQRPDNKNRQRFKNININKSNYINEEETNRRFDYTNLAEELLEKDDIKCSERVLEESCENFVDFNGETGLKEDLLMGIFAYGYETPSRIQSYAIPQIISGKDIIAQSQSGTGKTGAFVISTLQNIDENLNLPQAIILSPTCELAQQTFVVAKSLSNKMKNVKLSFTVGGSDRASNIKELGGVFQGKSDTEISQIIVATPGRLIDLITEFPQLFEHIKLLVIDECDELLSKSFKDEIKKIIEALSEETQICLFSATLTTDVVKLSDVILNEPSKILIKKEKVTLEGIKQTFIDILRPEDKFNVLIEMLATLPIQQFIVYVNSKKNAEELQTFLEEEGYSVLSINSSQPKYERADLIRRFKQGGIKCLISTDLLSRGIDIQQLSLVINYDLPRQNNIQNYIHRIGRTGRYGKKGLSINLVTKFDKDIQRLIEVTFKCNILPLQNDFITEI
jgi:superfamily II DNA/RNA helicase